MKKHTSPRASGANPAQTKVTSARNTHNPPQVHIRSSATSEPGAVGPALIGAAHVAAAACLPIPSWRRRVVVSWCRHIAARWSRSRSLAWGGKGRREPRVRNAPSSGRTGGLRGCRCLARARVEREDEREDKNKKMRGGAVVLLRGGGADKRLCLRGGGRRPTKRRLRIDDRRPTTVDRRTELS